MRTCLACASATTARRATSSSTWATVSCSALHAKSDLLTVRPGSLQLGFTVASVDRLVAQCAEQGVPVFEDPYDEPAARVAVIGDPDGYPVQVSSLRKR